MIPSSLRFHGHNSLRYVYANGKAVRSQAMTIKWTKNTHRTRSRVSVVVSKKVLKSAIGRNRIRRRIYEYMRLNETRLIECHDIVLIVTSPEFRDMPAPELSSQLDQLFIKAALYKTPTNWYNIG